MTASEIIYQKLNHLVDGRVYPLVVPEQASISTPYIIYNIIASTPDNTLDGITGHEWVSVQIDIYSDDYDAMLSLCSQVISHLNTITPSHYDGVVYRFDDGLYRAIVEYEFWQTVI